jgi:hypothetical protein
MITREELKKKTGYDSFLNFKRHCQGSSESGYFAGLTKYHYNHKKEIELDLRPEELFMEADREISQLKIEKKLLKKLKK